MSENRIFILCSLSLHQLITSPLHSIDGILITLERPYGAINHNIYRPVSSQQYYIKKVSKNISTGKISRRTYGIITSSTIIITNPYNFVIKPFGYYLEQLSNYLYQVLIHIKEELSLVTSGLSTSFNHCTTLFYYSDKALICFYRLPI